MYIYSSFNFSSYMSCFIVLVTKKLEFARVRSSLRAVGDTVRPEDVLYKSSHMYYTHIYMYIHTYVHMYICIYSVHLFSHLWDLVFVFWQNKLEQARVRQSFNAVGDVESPDAPHTSSHVCYTHTYTCIYIYMNVQFSSFSFMRRFFPFHKKARAGASLIEF